jgi:polysaccharide biosynthesis protein PslH
MKILMLTPYLPYPPSSGGQIRSYNLIKQLSKKHEITLCSLIKHEEDRVYVDKLKPFCKKVLVFKRAQKPWTISNILKTGFSLFPFLVIRNFSSSEKIALNEILKEEKFDIIHAETFYVTPHIPKTDIPIVLVDQTIEYQVYQHYVKNFRIPILRPLLFLDVLKIKYWETYYWKRASVVVAVSDKDALAMKKLVKKLKVTVVPNGVGEDLMEDVPLHYCPNILFMGNFAWLQNAEAATILAQQVFPLIQAKIPNVKLFIAGQNVDKIKVLEDKNIILKNFAVDDIKSVQDIYRSSGVLIAPLYGPGGTRLKILAAMAAKLPVVTTKVGIAGVGEPGVSYLEGESIEELAAGAIKLFQDKDLYKKIAENARKLVEKEYSYESISKKLSDIYEQSLNNKN